MGLPNKDSFFSFGNSPNLFTCLRSPILFACRLSTWRDGIHLKQSPKTLIELKDKSIHLIMLKSCTTCERAVSNDGGGPRSTPSLSMTFAPSPHSSTMALLFRRIDECLRFRGPGSWGAFAPWGGWHKKTAFSTSTSDSISMKLRFIW